MREHQPIDQEIEDYLQFILRESEKGDISVVQKRSVKPLTQKVLVSQTTTTTRYSLLNNLKNYPLQIAFFAALFALVTLLSIALFLRFL